MNRLFFTAGPNGESDGVFGAIDVPEVDSLAMLAAGVLIFGLVRPRRRT